MKSLTASLAIALIGECTLLCNAARVPDDVRSHGSENFASAHFGKGTRIDEVVEKMQALNFSIPPLAIKALVGAKATAIFLPGPANFVAQSETHTGFFQYTEINGAHRVVQLTCCPGTLAPTHNEGVMLAFKDREPGRRTAKSFLRDLVTGRQLEDIYDDLIAKFSKNAVRTFSLGTWRNAEEIPPVSGFLHPRPKMNGLRSGRPYSAF